jgi:hypothetical protein
MDCTAQMVSNYSQIQNFLLDAIFNLNNLPYHGKLFFPVLLPLNIYIFAMSVDGTMNGSNATSVNYSIEDVVIKSFDTYGSHYSLPV